MEARIRMATCRSEMNHIVREEPNSEGGFQGLPLLFHRCCYFGEIPPKRFVYNIKERFSRISIIDTNTDFNLPNKNSGHMVGICKLVFSFLSLISARILVSGAN